MRLSELADRLGAELRGDGTELIHRVVDLRNAQVGDIAFMHDSSYAATLPQCKASALLLRAEDAAAYSGNVLVVRDPYLAYAKVAQWLDTTPRPAPGIHASACVADSALIESDVHIAPHAVIGERVRLGAGVIVGAGCVIGDDSVLGAGTRLWPHVSIYHAVHIGERCTVHSGSVIGSDGFGYAQERAADGQRLWVRIPQLGGVSIGNDVDIGANCAIDRGALRDTVIGNGVKLDNFIHVAHNVHIGDHSAAAAMTGVAGSTKIGRHVTLAGRVSVIGHLEICDGAHVTACTTVIKSITEPGVYSSGTTAQPNKEWRKSLARFFQIDDLFRRVRALEARRDYTQDE